MHCKNCEYPLWNIPARICPECGTSFAPSEFEFVPNAVRFCCGHCEQEYYGTGLKGHLVPEAFECVKCGEPVHMDEMILRPAEGVQDQDTQATFNPWLERAKRGRFKSWMKTIGRSLIMPGRLIQSTQVNSSGGQALWFAMLTFMTPLLVMLVPLMGLIAVLIGGISRGAGGQAPPNIIMVILLTMVVWVVGMVIFIVTYIGLWSLATHGLLKITGSLEAGLGRTFQAICYSSGVNVLNILALCGGSYVSYVWWCVSATIMVKDGHKIHGGRAAFAVLTPPILMIVIVIGLYVSFVALIFAGSNSGSLTFSPEPEPGIMTTQILAHASMNNGEGPDHAATLIDGSSFFAEDFVSADSSTYTEDISVGNVALYDLNTLEDQDRRDAVQAAVEAMPENVIAHRLGDFVFTYHGMNLNDAHSGLWILIYSYDPDSLLEGDFQAEIAMGLVGGSTITATPAEFPAMLQTQNALRANHGLPPLPDPATVTHSNPATGEILPGN